MDTSPALLLLLALRFCCPGIFGQSLQIKVTSPKDINQLRVGQKLELECQTYKDSGAFWIHQDKSGALHAIVFINSISRVTFQGNQKQSSRFEASKHNTIYHLAVKSFTPQDQGKYFCVMNFNQMLQFSPGQPVFLPATTVGEPTTQWGITEKDLFLKSPDPGSLNAGSRIEEDLNYFCLVFIWVPLAGLCLLLLQLMAVTRMVMCRRKVHHNPL
ncbi:T-cell surface glycoprotein CD8 alpha chain [Parus major]|uniref:T-cell surface glycoprotein CD8 alpha chain n=1 Tax=Parus major TaxID=9157 RepID=UPI00144458F9|nr:T-cell surface glycoprotein CD8 alpha chain [Parus major]